MTPPEIRWLVIRYRGAVLSKRLHAFESGKRISLCGAGDRAQAEPKDLAAAASYSHCAHCTRALAARPSKRDSLPAGPNEPAG